MEAPRASGLITEPKGWSESVYLTAEGLTEAKRLAERHFGTGAAR